MFLNIYLFLSNTMFLSICSIYIRFIFLGRYLDHLKDLKEKKDQLKFLDKEGLKEQLEYIKIKDEIDDIEFKMLGWKFLSIMVAIFMALTIVKTEPIVIFGIQWNLVLMIITMIILNYINIKILEKLGVKI